MNKIASLFGNRRIVIATMHGKEKVIGPPLIQKLGVHIVVPKNFNSDQFGTFSGEIERGKDILETAHKKCELAMEFTGCDLAIANEGSFGPHPSLYVVPCNDEFIYFIDKKNNLSFWSRTISTETNFNSKSIQSIEDAFEFGKQVGFPDHGLIVRNGQHSFDFIKKGVTTYKDLEKYTAFSLKKYGTCSIETDMRATYNPKRMMVIADVTQQLLNKITSLCPKCEFPGFSISKSIAGLPCEQCSFPTSSVKKHLKKCASCNYEEFILFPNGKEFENPMYCDNCNP